MGDADWQVLVEVVVEGGVTVGLVTCRASGHLEAHSDPAAVPLRRVDAHRFGVHVLREGVPHRGLLVAVGGELDLRRDERAVSGRFFLEKLYPECWFGYNSDELLA